MHVISNKYTTFLETILTFAGFSQHQWDVSFAHRKSILPRVWNKSTFTSQEAIDVTAGTVDWKKMKFLSFKTFHGKH